MGQFDRQSGEWIRDEARHIKWVARLGSQSYGNPVIALGQVYVGTNNGSGYLKRFPAEVDLGCLLCFRESDGQFLWQHSNEKLPTGRVHDWPLQGVCCAPLVEGDRLWYVSNRGCIVCLDTQGFHDGEDDGPVQNELGRLFDVMKNDDPAKDELGPIVAALNSGQASEALRKLFSARGVVLPETIDLKAEEAGKKWSLSAQVGAAARRFELSLAGPRLSASRCSPPTIRTRPMSSGATT